MDTKLRSDCVDVLGDVFLLHKNELFPSNILVQNSKPGDHRSEILTQMFFTSLNN